MVELTKAEIEQGFEELGDRLRRQRLIGEIAVYGGAAMVLYFRVSAAGHLYRGRAASSR
jgi:hypothetical protein